MKIEFENYFVEMTEESAEKCRNNKHENPPRYNRTMIRKKIPKKLARLLGISLDSAFYVGLDGEALFLSTTQLHKPRAIGVRVIPCYMEYKGRKESKIPTDNETNNLHKE